MAIEIGRSSLVRNMMRPRTIIPVGDSNTLSASAAQTGDVWNYGPNVIEAAVFGAKDMRMLRNAGIGGDTAAMIEARLQADVLAYAPDACLLMTGTNDLSSGMANAGYAALMNSVERIVLRMLDAGILPIIVTPPPKNSAANELRRAQPFYYWLAEYYGLPLFDLYRICVDPATSGNFKSGYSPDNLHLNPTATAAVIPVLAAKLADIPSMCSPAYLAAVSQSGVGDMSNMIRNGSFALGTAPSSITGWGTVTTNNTITLENPVLPQTGKVCKHVSSDDADKYGLYGSDVTVVSGNRMVFSGLADISSMDPATDSGFQVSLGYNGGQARPMNAWKQNGSFGFSMEFVVPPGITTLTPQVFITDAATYQFANFTLTDRTALGAIWTPGLQ